MVPKQTLTGINSSPVNSNLEKKQQKELKTAQELLAEAQKTQESAAETQKTQESSAEIKIAEEMQIEIKTKRELDLEEIEGKIALELVESRNKECFQQFASSESFKEMERSALAICEDKRTLPLPTLVGNYLYNFWRDDVNIQGIYRRTTLEEYRKELPNWETVLDLDKLPEESIFRSLINPENHKANTKENWVFKDFIYCFPDATQGMLNLSLGGMDAGIWREFDLIKKEFVQNGFCVKEARTSISWYTKDSYGLLQILDKESLQRQTYLELLNYGSVVKL